MDFTIQRFLQGHKFYTDKTITNTDAQMGVVGTFGSVFGQCIDANGKFMHYTMERLDTLIDEGVYDFDLFYSNLNKCIVPRLTIFNGEDISARELEHHIANEVYQLRGCCAHGMAIDLNMPALNSSRVAFTNLMTYINGEVGKITYETLKEATV